RRLEQATGPGAGPPAAGRPGARPPPRRARPPPAPLPPPRAPPTARALPPPEPRLDTQSELTSVFEDTLESHSDYELPDRTLLRQSTPAKTPAQNDSRIAEALVQTLANFGVDATIVGQIAGPRVTRY